MALVPYVIEQTSRGNAPRYLFPLVKEIIFAGKVTDVSASLIVAQLLFLESEDPGRY